MKVHELAKELDVQSKDIIAFLHEKGIEVKAAQSTIDDDAVASVRNKFSKKAAPKAEPVKEAPKAEPVKAAPAAEAKPAAAPAGDAQAPVKKKKIIFVNNPHNSKMPGQSQGGNRPQQGNGQRPQGQGGNRPSRVTIRDPQVRDAAPFQVTHTAITLLSPVPKHWPERFRTR